MNRDWMRAAVAAATIAVGAGAFLAGRARAAGIPASGALTYSGLLQDGAGVPLTGTEYVEVKFWNDASITAAANLLCDTGTPTGIGLVGGRFSIQLPDDCTARVGTNAQVWAEVLLGSTSNTVASLGRAKLGAVPYAVEADHAATATTAASPAAGGQIASAISALQAEVHPASAFHAYQMAAYNVANGTNPLALDTVEFDLAGEYATVSGIFTPKSAGIYLLNCQIEFILNASADWAAVLLKNGNQLGVTDISIAANNGGISPAVFGVFKLAAGDQVQCASHQDTGAAQPLYVGSTNRNTFSGARLY